MASPKYPTTSEIESLCSHLASSDQTPFFDRVSPHVEWDVMGTHPLSGHFPTLKAWQDNALGTINKALQQPLQPRVVNVAGGGDQAWAVVELQADAVCKNGMEYRQNYAWIMRFDEHGTIVQVRAYLDSALVQKAIDANA